MGEKRIDFSEIQSSGSGLAAHLDGGTHAPRGDGLDYGSGRTRSLGTRGFVPPPASSYEHLDAYARHKHFINTYVLHYMRDDTNLSVDVPKYKTDYDILKDEHRFLWTPEDEEGLTWERRLAKKYYDKLFKEYAITDLSRYKENKIIDHESCSKPNAVEQIALRWRVQQEVFDGKGQFMCGSKGCKETRGLQSWEVNFAYKEHGEQRNALVKLRLCPGCSAKLNYRTQKRKAKEAKRKLAQREEEEKIEDRERRKRIKTGSEVEAEGPALPPGTKILGAAATPAEGQAAGDEVSVDVWKGKRAEKDEEQAQEEEFDAYFDDMLL